MDMELDMELALDLDMDMELDLELYMELDMKLDLELDLDLDLDLELELELDMGLDLVCNLDLKNVKELKHQRRRKGPESVLFDEEGNPKRFDNWIFSQEPHQVLHSRVFKQEWIGSFS